MDWSQQHHNPVSGGSIHWGKYNGSQALHLDVPRDDIDAVWTPDLAFHDRVKQGHARLPCFTTPAPDDHGRAAPKKSRGKISESTRTRWLQGARQFAPWHYEEHAMLRDSQSNYVIPPPAVKEQLHHLPIGYTANQQGDDRARHHMLGNSWHKGVAVFLLLFVLQWSEVVAIPPTPHYSSLQRALQLAGRCPGSLGLGPFNKMSLLIPPCDDMETYWHNAQTTLHPLLAEPRLEPGLQLTVDRLLSFPGDLNRFRSEVIHDLRLLVEERSEQTLSWWQQLPPHVASVYSSGRDTSITQIPIFLELLQQCGYPAMDDLSADLHRGFDLVGPQHPGPGWLPRTDDRYSAPLDLQTFEKVNASYLHQKLRHPRVDEHWQHMLTEILEDKAKGKITGPYRGPDSWPVTTVGLSDHDLLPLQQPVRGASICFSVVQTDKIRRCEDFRRSYHNKTIGATDSPHHHCISECIALALWWLRQGFSIAHIWALTQRTVNFPYAALAMPM